MRPSYHCNGNPYASKTASLWVLRYPLERLDGFTTVFIFIMGISMLVKQHFYIETRPWGLIYYNYLISWGKTSMSSVH